MHWSSTKQHLHKLIECNLFSSWYTWKIAHLVFLNTVKPAQTTTFIKRPPAINDHFYPPRRFILYILTGFNDHLHNATNDRQNAFPNDHFNFFQRPLTLFAWWAYNKNGENDRGCSPNVTFIFRIRKPEVIFFVPKIMFSLLLSFLIKNMFIFFNISAFLAFSCGFKIY